MNANTMVVLQIETQRALDARREPLAVPGIDAVMVGPAGSRGRVRDSCVEFGIAPGTQTRSAALAKFWKERGMLFLGCGNDSGMLYERAVELVTQIRQ